MNEQPPTNADMQAAVTQALGVNLSGSIRLDLPTDQNSAVKRQRELDLGDVPPECRADAARVQTAYRCGLINEATARAEIARVIEVHEAAEAVAADIELETRRKAMHREFYATDAVYRQKIDGLLAGTAERIDKMLEREDKLDETLQGQGLAASDETHATTLDARRKLEEARRADDVAAINRLEAEYVKRRQQELAEIRQQAQTEGKTEATATIDQNRPALSHDRERAIASLKAAQEALLEAYKRSPKYTKEGLEQYQKRFERERNQAELADDENAVKKAKKFAVDQMKDLEEEARKERAKPEPIKLTGVTAVEAVPPSPDSLFSPARPLAGAGKKDDLELG